MNIFTDGGREFGRYPAGIYGKHLLNFLTYIVPMAAFQYYPLLILLDKSRRILYWFSPLLCLVFFLLCCLFWNVGIRCCRSSGS